MAMGWCYDFFWIFEAAYDTNECVKVIRMHEYERFDVLNADDSEMFVEAR